MNDLSKVQIKFASVDSIRDIAKCHRAAFPASLSSALGLTYVTKMLSWYLASDNTFLFYLAVNGKCAGYCGGMVRTHTGLGSASSMAQFSLKTAIFAFLFRPWLLFHREIREKYPFILRNLFSYLFRGPKKHPKAKAIEPYAGLVVIGVRPDLQGSGYGSLLLKEFERIAAERSVNRVALTVRPDNGRAIRSYLKNGWVVERQDAKSVSMMKDLRQNACTSC